MWRCQEEEEEDLAPAGPSEASLIVFVPLRLLASAGSREDGRM